MYLSAAGGGAWRSLNNGLTWSPLIDNVPRAHHRPDHASPGAIAVAPTELQRHLRRLGESNNSADSYYGRGVVKSSDYGKTWTLIQPPGNAFDEHTISKIVVDPVEADTVYVAVHGSGVNEGIGGGSNPGNYGIWRLRNGVWVNLTATLLPIRLQHHLSHRYTDLVVFNANPRITDTDVNHPNQPNRRVVAFAIGSFTGQQHRQRGLHLGGCRRHQQRPHVEHQHLPDHRTVRLPQPQRHDQARRRARLGGSRHDHHVRVITFPVDLARNKPGHRAAPSATCNRSPSTTPAAATGPGHAWGGMGGAARGASTATSPARAGTIRSSPCSRRTSTRRPALPSSATPTSSSSPASAASFTPGPFVFNGTAWNDVDPGTDGKGPHVDYHAAPSTAPAGSSSATTAASGAWKTSPPRRGRGRRPISTNLNGIRATCRSRTFNGLDVHPFNPFFAIGGSQDNGTETYNDSTIWNTTLTAATAAWCASTSRTRTSSSTSTNGSRLSLDAGRHLRLVDHVFPTTGAINTLYFPIILDRVNPSRILVGDFNNLRESIVRRGPGNLPGHRLERLHAQRHRQLQHRRRLQQPDRRRRPPGHLGRGPRLPPGRRSRRRHLRSRHHLRPDQRRRDQSPRTMAWPGCTATAPAATPAYLRQLRRLLGHRRRSAQPRHRLRRPQRLRRPGGHVFKTTDAGQNLDRHLRQPARPAHLEGHRRPAQRRRLRRHRQRRLHPAAAAPAPQLAALRRRPAQRPGHATSSSTRSPTC